MRSPPRHKSMTKCMLSGSLNTSCNFTMYLCWSRANICISTSILFLHSGSIPSEARRFTANSWKVFLWTINQTCPKPPCPSFFLLMYISSILCSVIISTMLCPRRLPISKSDTTVDFDREAAESETFELAAEEYEFARFSLGWSRARRLPTEFLEPKERPVTDFLNSGFETGPTSRAVRLTMVMWGSLKTSGAPRSLKMSAELHFFVGLCIGLERSETTEEVSE
mmetsp:Transcript_54375/g.156350  ORF Transcript_54375/g.156350 Transcript_54375/m.156350 type:complete len:224 (-) Transcript_54375:260-931(-)